MAGLFHAAVPKMDRVVMLGLVIIVSHVAPNAKDKLADADARIARLTSHDRDHAKRVACHGAGIRFIEVPPSGLTVGQTRDLADLLAPSGRLAAEERETLTPIFSTASPQISVDNSQRCG